MTNMFDPLRWLFRSSSYLKYDAVEFTVSRLEIACILDFGLQVQLDCG